jgi:hypothetical protein
MATGKKSKKVVEPEGIAHVNATFNNTTVTITDMHGNAVAWGSSGKAGLGGIQGLQEVDPLCRDGGGRAGGPRGADGRCQAGARPRAGPGQRA